MKKLIISKTILFAIIMAYIFGFKFLFGDQNILIAVMSITGLLMYMGRDLTGEPIKNTLGLIAFYILIGLATFFAASNILIAIPINLLVVFFISYSFCHTLKTPMYIPFTFLYLFLLAYKVPASQMPLRLLALATGAFSIMLPQFFINKNKIQKASSSIFLGLSDCIINKINLKKSNKDTKAIDLQIASMNKTLKNIIYDKKIKNFYISNEGKNSLDLLISLEKLSFLIDTIDKDKHYLLDIISKYITLFKDDIKNKNLTNSNTFVENLSSEFKNTTNALELKLLSSIIFIQCTLNTPIKKKINEDFKLKEDIYGLKNIRFNSIKLTYAIRISLLITLGCFLMQYFKLDQGRWIMYTVLSLTSPVLEQTKSKAKDRIISTIIGALFIAISFSIFKNTVIRGLIVLLAGYGNIYCKTYRQKIVFVTASAVGAASLVGGPLIGNTNLLTNPINLAFERIFFILIGAFLAILINNFLFKYDINKANNFLIKTSDSLITDLLNNLKDFTNKDRLNHYINNVYLLLFQIDDVIKNNSYLSENYKLSSEYEEMSNKKLMLSITSYELVNFINHINTSSLDIKNLNNISSHLENASTHLSDIKTLSGRIIMNSLIEIYSFKENIFSNEKLKAAS